MKQHNKYDSPSNWLLFKKKSNSLAPLIAEILAFLFLKHLVKRVKSAGQKTTIFTDFDFFWKITQKDLFIILSPKSRDFQVYFDVHNVLNKSWFHIIKSNIKVCTHFPDAR